MGSACRRNMSAVVASIVLGSAPALGVAPKASALKGLRTSGVRVLVFAPHPDDEVLGTAGLIRRVVEGNGSVRVVFMTGGDGFAAGVTRETHSPHPSADDYRWYAQRREEEAARSLATLGVRRDQIVFLGSPTGACVRSAVSFRLIAHPTIARRSRRPTARRRRRLSFATPSTMLPISSTSCDA